MSQVSEYILSCCGYNAEGKPAAVSQFTFGTMPAMVGETDDVEELTTVDAVCQSDAIVSMRLKDNLFEVIWDFVLDTETFVELAEGIETFKAQESHTEDILSSLNGDLSIAEQNEDIQSIEEIILKLRNVDLPFMFPTIMPDAYNGEVHVGFKNPPQFIYFTSETLAQAPTKIVMLFEAEDVYAEDDFNVYDLTAEDEIRAQQEEMFLMDEQRRMEEEAYMAQWGQNSGLYDEEDEIKNDSRLKGVKLK